MNRSIRSLFLVASWLASVLAALVVGFYLGRIEGYGAKQELRGNGEGWRHRYTETFPLNKASP